jgi:hypothetical protein
MEATVFQFTDQSKSLLWHELRFVDLSLVSVFEGDHVG